MEQHIKIEKESRCPYGGPYHMKRTAGACGWECGECVDAYMHELEEKALAQEHAAKKRRAAAATAAVPWGNGTYLDGMRKPLRLRGGGSQGTPPPIPLDVGKGVDMTEQSAPRPRLVCDGRGGRRNVQGHHCSDSAGSQQGVGVSAGDYADRGGRIQHTARTGSHYPHRLLGSSVRTMKGVYSIQGLHLHSTTLLLITERGLRLGPPRLVLHQLAPPPLLLPPPALPPARGTPPPPPPAPPSSP